MRKSLVTLLVALLVLPLAAPVIVRAQETIEVAQTQRRTLFDLLFGDERQQEQRRQRPQQSQESSAPVEAALPPPSPEVEKAEGATRLAVLGDSLAVDLARALARLHAEDPNLVVLDQGVGSSGFVRDDYFDWNAALGKAIAEDSFDIAVVIIGINDRQPLVVDGSSHKPLTDPWKAEYSQRLARFLQQMRSSGKPVIWVGLPPMQQGTYSAAMSQISSIQRLAAFAGGAEFVDIYERFVDESGNYTSYGPDLNGNQVQMRKGDGIHFSAAGADKVAFYVNQSLKLYYRGGTVTASVSDPLEGTDAQTLQRPPFQGLGQIRLLEVAGAVISLSGNKKRAGDLLLAGPETEAYSGFDIDQMVQAPVGRVDAFGVGIDPGAPHEARAVRGVN